MSIRKSRQIKRKQSKYKQSKRKLSKKKQTNKVRYQRKKNIQKTKKYLGGMFNSYEKKVLVEKLEEIGFTKNEIPDIMKKLDLGSQQFSGDNLRQLISQISGMDKERFNEWIEAEYSQIAEDVETDYESD